MMKTIKLLTIFCAMFLWTTSASAKVKEVKWDRQSLIIDGHRVIPVMGEVHYSRSPADVWEAEV